MPREIERIRPVRRGDPKFGWEIRYAGKDWWLEVLLGEHPVIDLLIARAERVPLALYGDDGIAVSDLPELATIRVDNVRDAWCLATMAASTVARRLRDGRPVSDVEPQLVQLRNVLRRIDVLTRGIGPFDDGPVQAIASKRVLRGCEFAVTEARTSKGPEWWAGFAAAGEPFAVSEVSSEDAIARARAYMAAHGWRDDMGAEVGLLLIRAYERGRDDESAARGGIRIHDDDDVAL